MGRPKTFNREEAVHQAMDLFRRKSYDTASVSDLVEATGVNRFSLYECFGDKHGLFLEALDEYHEQRHRQLSEVFSADAPITTKVTNYFESIATEAMSNEISGCLMVNSAVTLAKTDVPTAERVTHHYHRLEETVLVALTSAQAKGELSPEKNLRQLARFIINNARGLRVITQYARDTEVVNDIIEVALKILGPAS